MRGTASRIFFFITLLVAIVFLVLLVNQTSQLVTLASTFHPLAGQAVLWGLVFLYAACALVPIISFLRLPKPLSPPESEDSPEFQRHVQALGRRLQGNRLLGPGLLSSRSEIEEALRTLDASADEVIRSAGSQVFITTAVSQNGSLDSILVLAVQSKLVWRLAHVYYQRPTIRDLSWLYANVLATAFVAGELEDVDLSEQIQPVVSGVLGSAAGAIPGLQAASSLFLTSVFNGTANAFLTLRVGIIAKQYCNTLVRRPTRALRRSAIAEATVMLGSTVLGGTRRLSEAFVRASSQKVTGAVRDIGGRVREAGSTLVGKLGFGDREDEH